MEKLINPNYHFIKILNGNDRYQQYHEFMDDNCGRIQIDHELTDDTFCQSNGQKCIKVIYRMKNHGALGDVFTWKPNTTEKAANA